MILAQWFVSAYTEVPIEVALLDVTQWDPMWDGVLGDVKGSPAGIVAPVLVVLFIRWFRPFPDHDVVWLMIAGFDMRGTVNDFWSFLRRVFQVSKARLPTIGKRFESNPHLLGTGWEALHVVL